MSMQQGGTVHRTNTSLPYHHIPLSYSLHRTRDPGTLAWVFSHFYQSGDEMHKLQNLLSQQGKPKIQCNINSSLVDNKEVSKSVGFRALEDDTN